MIFVRDSFPKRIILELTNQCNMDCSFCPRQLVNMEIGHMKKEVSKKVIDEASENLPVALAVFFRGESILYENLIEIIKYAKLKGLGPIQLSSNGLDFTEKLAEEIILSGVDFISFSIDTNDIDCYTRVKPKGDIVQVLKNVTKFCELCLERKKINYKVPEIQITTVDMPIYKSEQKEFISFWLKYADQVRVYAQHSSSGQLGSINDRDMLSNHARRPCNKVFTEIAIYWDGRVAICNHDWDNCMHLGNAKEHSIKEIWNSKKYQAIRSNHETGNYSEDLICKYCDHWKAAYLPEGYIGEKYMRNQMVKE